MISPLHVVPSPLAMCWTDELTGMKPPRAVHVGGERRQRPGG